MTASEQTFTPVEAASICGVSLDTVRRRIRAGKIPGAVRLGEAPFGEWALPLAGLVASGLSPQSQPAAQRNPGAGGPEIAELRAEVVRWQERAEAAERMVDELRSEITFNRRVLEQLASVERSAA